MKRYRILQVCCILIFMVAITACGNSNNANTLSDNSSTSAVKKAPPLLPTPARSNVTDIKLSIAQVPGLADSKDKGTLIDLAKAMAGEYKEGKITWNVYPFRRSIDNVSSGIADVHFPLIYDPTLKEDVNYMYSTGNIYKMIIVLYSNVNNKDINAQNIDKYKAEVLYGHSKYFNNLPETSYDAGLKKVDAGRLDVFIGPMKGSDATIKNLNLKNIKRTKYREFDVKMILSRNDKGKQVDKILSGIIAKLNANGKYQQIMGNLVNLKYVDW